MRGTSVVVAGAGLAGLSAAHDLCRRGADVTVFEARDRVGGRVRTVRDPFEGGQHAEAGADFIDEDQATIRRLAAELSLPLVPILRGGFGFVRRGLGGAPDVLPPGHTPWQSFIASLQELIVTYRLIEDRWDSPVAAALGRRSIAEWLDDTRAGEEMRSLARGLRSFFLADPDDLSLLPVLEEFAEDSTPGADQMYRVEGGNDRLAEGLASALAKPVVLQAPLVGVAQDSHKVRVKVSGDRRGLDEVTTDYLVLAVPASLARDIEWTPRLPDAQHEAIARLKYGFATKTLLQFDRRFWQVSGRARAYGTDLTIGAAWDANEGQPGQQGIVALLAGGSISNATEALLQRGGLEALVQELGWFGAADARLVVSQSLRWEDDRWARGGYAYFDPGYPPTLRQWLARPFGRVLFAGEHTSRRWQGYLNGAVESGLRAAAEVAALQETSRT